MNRLPNTRTHNPRDGLRLAGTVLVAILAQVVMVGRPRNAALGIVLYAAAITAVWPLYVSTHLRPAPSCDCQRGLAAADRRRWAAVLWFGALVSSLLCLCMEVREANTPAVVFWVTGWALCLLSSWMRSSHRVHLDIPGRELALVFAVTAIGFVLRLAALDSVPALLAGDEAAMGLEGQRVLAGTLPNWFGTGWFAHPSLYFVLQAASQRVWGASVFALRFTSAVGGSLAIPALYGLARRWWGARVALISAVLLAVNHFHLHYSRLGLNNVWDALFVLGTLYWLDRAMVEGEAWPWACLGLTVGMGQYGYWGSRVLPLVVLGMLVWRWGSRSHVERRLFPEVLAGAFTTGVVVSPLALYFMRQPQEYVARYAQLGVLRPGWLSQTAASQGISTVRLACQQLWRSLLAFHYYTDAGVLYGAPIPLLDLVSAVLFVFGVVAVLRTTARHVRVCLALCFGLVLLFGSVLLVDPPTSQRLVILSPLLCLLPALGLDRIVSLAQNCLAWDGSFSTIVRTVVVLAMAWGNVHYYFRVYTPGGYFLERNSELLDAAGRFLGNLDPGVSVYWFGAPRVYADSPVLQFLAPQVHVRDVADPMTSAAEQRFPAASVFLFVPERLAELDVVRAHVPQGLATELWGRGQTLLLVAYEVP